MWTTTYFFFLGDWRPLMFNPRLGLGLLVDSWKTLRKLIKIDEHWGFKAAQDPFTLLLDALSYVSLDELAHGFRALNCVADVTPVLRFLFTNVTCPILSEKRWCPVLILRYPDLPENPTVIGVMLTNLAIPNCTSWKRAGLSLAVSKGISQPAKSVSESWTHFALFLTYMKRANAIYTLMIHDDPTSIEWHLWYTWLS